MELYIARPDRYQLRRGKDYLDTPKCPYGNTYRWIGYDLELEEYVRFTKSVFKLLIQKESNK